MRESQTIVLERNTLWEGAFATEPCEVAWASEAIFFIRTLEVDGVQPSDAASVQLSPDGIHWCDEGDIIRLPMVADLTYHRVSCFGGWLRLSGVLPPGARMKVIVYLALKE